VIAERGGKTGGRGVPTAEPTETCRRLADNEPHVLGRRLALRHCHDLKEARLLFWPF